MLIGLLNQTTAVVPAEAMQTRIGAVDKLTSLLKKIDGQNSPPDWMGTSTDRADLAARVQLLIDKLELVF